MQTATINDCEIYKQLMSPKAKLVSQKKKSKAFEKKQSNCLDAVMGQYLGDLSNLHIGHYMRRHCQSKK
jgi:hypothetical protein